MGTTISNFLNSYFYNFDNAGIVFMHKLAELNNPIINGINIFFSIVGNKCILFLIIALIMCYFKKTRKCGIAIILSIAAAFVINSLILKKIIMRPRPYSVNDLYLLWYEMVGSRGSSSYSFPSGHVAGLTAGLTALCMYYKKFLYIIMSIILTILMSMSRVFFVVHYPTDCIAGAIVGVICAIITVTIFDKYTNLVYNIIANKILRR